MVNYANNSSRAAALVEELNKIPSTASTSESPRFHAIQADVGDRNAIDRLIEDTVKTMGRLDVVVSNAGWTRITNFANIEEQMLEEDWDKCFLYNVKSHLWLAYAARAELGKTEGAFITTASVAGVKPSGSSLPYSVTKAAAIHLTKGLAVICAPQKIRVNAVSPGLMLTEWGLKFPQSKIDKSTENTKLKRLATVEVRHVRVYDSRVYMLTYTTGRCGSSQNAGSQSFDDGTEHCSGRWSDIVGQERDVTGIDLKYHLTTSPKP